MILKINYWRLKIKNLIKERINKTVNNLGLLILKIKEIFLQMMKILNKFRFSKKVPWKVFVISLAIVLVVVGKDKMMKMIFRTRIKHEIMITKQNAK